MADGKRRMEWRTDWDRELPYEDFGLDPVKVARLLRASRKEAEKNEKDKSEAAAAAVASADKKQLQEGRTYPADYVDKFGTCAVCFHCPVTSAMVMAPSTPLKQSCRHLFCRKCCEDIFTFNTKTVSRSGKSYGVHCPICKKVVVDFHDFGFFPGPSEDVRNQW